MPAIAQIPITAAFQGIVPIPMFELPWSWPAAEINSNWVFHRGDYWPTTTKQRRVNAATNPYLIQQEAYIGNPFTNTYAKFPSASKKWSDVSQTTTETPIFVYDRLLGTISNNTQVLWYSYWMPAFTGLLNSVAATMPRVLTWNKTTQARGFGETVQGTTQLLFADAGGTTLPGAMVGKVTLDSFGNIRNFGRRYADNVATYNDLYSLTNTALFNPLYNLPDYDGDRNYLVENLNAGSAFRKRPTITQFSIIGGAVFDPSALWTQVFFDDFSANEFNQMFDLTVTPTTGPLWSQSATFIGDKHLWSSPNANSLTPDQNLTLLAVNKDGTKYWVLNLLPQDATAAAMIGETAGHMAAFSIAGDPNGNLYVGIPNVFTGTIQKVISSFGLSIPLNFSTPKLYGVSVPCYGTCEPAMIKSQQI